MSALFSIRSARTLVALVLALVAGSLSVLPSFAAAATYAYVNQSGEVRMVTADTPTLAIANAPSIHVHSGVLWLNSVADNAVIGDRVVGL